MFFVIIVFLCIDRCLVESRSREIFFIEFSIYCAFIVLGILNWVLGIRFFDFIFKGVFLV